MPVGSSASSTAGRATTARAIRHAVVASRQTLRARVGAFGKAYARQGGARTGCPIGGAIACNDKRQGNVIENAAILEQVWILEHGTDLLAISRYGPRLHAGQIESRHPKRAAGRKFEAKQKTQQCALAGAAVTRQESQLAALETQTDVRKCVSTIGIALADPIKFDHAGASTRDVVEEAATKSSGVKGRGPRPPHLCR